MVLESTSEGIDFSGVGSSAQTLDSYEEGTYNPTITAATGSLTTVSATGNYTKVGRLVTFAVDITITNNGTGAGNIRSTLPFASSGIAQYGAGRETSAVGFALTGTVVSSTVFLVKTADDTYPAANGHRLQFSATYIV